MFFCFQICHDIDDTNTIVVGVVIVLITFQNVSYNTEYVHKINLQMFEYVREPL